MGAGFRRIGGGGEVEAEVGDGGGHDGVVEEGLAALVGGTEGGVEEFGGESREAAGGAEEEFHGGVGEQVVGGAGGAAGVLDHGDEGGAVAAVEDAGRDDPHGEGSVVLHLEAPVERGEADEPEGQQVAAVEVVVEEGGELLQKVVGEEVGLVEDEDGLDLVVVDEALQGALEVGPELAAAVVRPEAELAGEGAVDPRRGEGRVAEVEDAVPRARELGAEVAQRWRIVAVLPTPGSPTRRPRPGSSDNQRKTRAKRAKSSP